MVTDEYRVPPCPAQLHKSGQDAWADLCQEYELEDADELRVLALYCECLDRAAQCRRILRDSGLYWTDRLENIRPHPAIATEAKVRAQAATILGQLSRSRLAWQKYEDTSERLARLEARQDADAGRRRDRRGGGVRRVGA